MMGVDAACLAEPMLGRPGAPLIQRQMIGPLQDADIGQPSRNDNRTAPAAKRTIAAPGRGKAVVQRDLRHNGTAVTGSAQRPLLVPDRRMASAAPAVKGGASG